ncbi:succinyl-CoA--3-ketoacid-CoA transferase [Alkalihalophilus pseudofirmus]|uniref:CoA transferase subunit A n=1 Tax=Alkalihalobacterium alkalinitrilicum TaxID=427920 RepID=UPI00094D212D|nr:CoA transferase subunit A [Alkalihalobacterium alkalinitrilicum]OLO42208.1 succinyl-CoA--3-ketoacid-CoA transferase [Alkalihalophilus pseudofirmus]
MKNKIMNTKEAISKIKSNDTIMVGGFGLVGAPLTLIDELTKHEIEGLTVISNNIGEAGKGLGILLRQGKIKKVVGSYFTSNREVADYYNAGEIDVQLLPQGTLSESIRAGGAGIGGYYTKTSVGTELAKGKDVKEIDGEMYVFEKALKANVAIVKAAKADRLGNLVYYKTARNFNPMMVTAADYVIAEVDEIVEVGQLSPEEIVSPHLYVDAIVESQLILSKEGVTVK